VKAKLHTHRECVLKLHLVLHTFYIRDCLLATLSENVFSANKNPTDATVASIGFLFTLNYDARNHELIIKNVFLGYNVH